jgi:hypothetical protein
LVLGLDLGTTTFKIAMLAIKENLQSEKPLQLIKNPDAYPIVLANFPGHQQHNISSVPTCLVYDRQGRRIKWAHDAESYQSDDNFNPDFLVHDGKTFDSQVD